MTINRKHVLPFLLVALTACSDGGESRLAATTDVAEMEPAPAAPASGSDPREFSIAHDPIPSQAAAAPDGEQAALQRAPARDVATTVAAADTAAAAAVQPGTVPSVSLDPMLIRTGTATVQVDSLEQGIAQVRALAHRVGGIVGNASVTGGAEAERHATVELRIPSQSFDAAVNGLSPIGKVRSVNVTAQDVGEEYADVNARVANARRLEARLLDLLDRRTGRLEEILNLEREVARVREEIERYEGRLRYLRTRASISTLTITLHEPQAVIGSPPGERPIRDAFGAAWRNFVGLVAGLIAMLGWLIPLAILAYPVWRAWRWFRRREAERDAAYRESIRRAREKAPEEPAPLP